MIKTECVKGMVRFHCNEVWWLFQCLLYNEISWRRE